MKSELRVFKWKIFLRAILWSLVFLVVGWVIFNLLIDGLWQDSFAEGFVHAVQWLFSVPYERGREIYVNIFRENKLILTIVFFVFLMLVAFYLCLTYYIRSFAQVARGVNQITDDTVEKVEFSPAMKFMERRINTVKYELRREKEAAEASEKKKNDLIIYLAHDLKTPLTSVIGYLMLLRDNPNMDEEQRLKYTEITLNKATHLEMLINEFFDITRFSIHSIALEIAPISLDLMLAQIADEFYPKLMERGQEAVFQVQDGLMMDGDAEKLARVFNNCLKNAIAYSPENSQIVIGACNTERGTEVWFENPGVEISEEELSHLFETFYRRDSARSSYAGGSGLGLAIAREIVVAHGGEIRAESEGTLFRIRIIFPQGKTEHEKWRIRKRKTE